MNVKQIKGQMKIAHISDLHICTSGRHTNIKKTERLLEYLLLNSFDHIVITGDITDNASRTDLRAARKLFKKYELLSSDKLTLIPGNHDIYGGIDRAEDILHFPSRCRRTDYKKKVEDFFDIFSEAFDKINTLSNSSRFPFAKELEDAVLIGINTNDRYSKLKNPFAANGRVQKDEFRGLRKMLAKLKDSGKPLILLSHHHFYKKPMTCSAPSALWNKIEIQTMKLRGRKKLIKLLHNEGIRLVLHGHMHETADYLKKGIRFLNAGNTFSTVNKQIQFNSITITDGMIGCQTVTLPSNKRNDFFFQGTFQAISA